MRKFLRIIRREGVFKSVVHQIDDDPVYLFRHAEDRLVVKVPFEWTMRRVGLHKERRGLIVQISPRTVDYSVPLLLH